MPREEWSGAIEVSVGVKWNAAEKLYSTICNDYSPVDMTLRADVAFEAIEVKPAPIASVSDSVGF